VAESALLAARIQNPVSFDDPDNVDKLQARYDYVLDGMVSEGWLPAGERATQTLPAIRDNSGDVRFAGQSGYLVAATQNELATLGFTEEEIQRGGLRVRTTFEPKAQAAAEAAITAELPPVAEWPENFHAALAAVRPGTGEVVAIYGGRGYQAGAFFNDAIQGAAQPGSTFKPFALVAGLQNEVSLRDRFSGANNREFPEYDSGRPVPNFGGESFGNIDLVTATENSVNTVFVDLTIEVGPEKVVQSAIAAGIPEGTQDLVAQPSVVLGVANVHPVDLANAYSTLAAGGQRTPWHVIAEVLGPDGEVRYTATAQPEQVIAPDVVSDVSYALQAVVEDGSGFAAQELGRPSAGKTGTTNDNKSSWYAGYVPQLAGTVALWAEGSGATLAGFGGRETVTGGSFPASVWTAFMQGALEGTEVAEFPEPAYVNDGDDESDGGPPPTTTSTAPPPPPTTTEPPPTSTGPQPTTTEPPPTTSEPPPTTSEPPPTTEPTKTPTVPPTQRVPDGGSAAAQTSPESVGTGLAVGVIGLVGAAGAATGLASLRDRDLERARPRRRRSRAGRHRHGAG
jgi:membrane peptidoglycan carboxypeptidase